MKNSFVLHALLDSYSLKSYQSCRGMENDAISCVLAHEGKPILTYLDSGCGGETNITWGATVERAEHIEAFKQFTELDANCVDLCQNKSPAWCEHFFTDIVMEALINHRWLTQTCKRKSKTHIMLLLDDNLHSYKLISAHQRGATLSALRSKHKDAIFFDDYAGKKRPD